MAILTSNELRNGIVFIMDGEPWMVVKFEHIKMGRGSATNKVKAKNLKTGSIIEKGFSTNSKFEEADVTKKTAQYLYSDSDKAHFMNPDSFEQYELDAKLYANDLLFLKEGDKLIIVFLIDDPISIELPKNVELKVVYTEQAVRGNTSGNVLKNAELETGLNIMVPSFVKNDDIIRINTEKKEYTERVNK